MTLILPRSTIQRYFTLHHAIAHARRQVAAPPTRPPAGSPSATPAQPPAIVAAAGRGEDVCVARHHNGVCLICLSPSHPIVRGSATVKDITYRVPLRAVKGKRKRDGLIVEPGTRLCTVTLEGREEGEREEEEEKEEEEEEAAQYTVLCGVAGVLLEYNDVMLAADPDLLRRKPLTDGFLAAVLPLGMRVKTAVDHLLDGAEVDAVRCAYPGDEIGERLCAAAEKKRETAMEAAQRSKRQWQRPRRGRGQGDGAGGWRGDRGRDGGGRGDGSGDGNSGMKNELVAEGGTGEEFKADGDGDRRRSVSRSGDRKRIRVSDQT